MSRPGQFMNVVLPPCPWRQSAIQRMVRHPIPSILAHHPGRRSHPLPNPLYHSLSGLALIRCPQPPTFSHTPDGRFNRHISSVCILNLVQSPYQAQTIVCFSSFFIYIFKNCHSENCLKALSNFFGEAGMAFASRPNGCGWGVRVRIGVEGITREIIERAGPSARPKWTRGLDSVSIGSGWIPSSPASECSRSSGNSI